MQLILFFAAIININTAQTFDSESTPLIDQLHNAESTRRAADKYSKIAGKCVLQWRCPEQLCHKLFGIDGTALQINRNTKALEVRFVSDIRNVVKLAVPNQFDDCILYFFRSRCIRYFFDQNTSLRLVIGILCTDFECAFAFFIN